MENIASFSINHLILEPGIYVSRKDHVGAETLTTFDIRMTAPNREPAINTGELHTIEHLGAIWLRNDPYWKEKLIYFGPMGCRTGNYMVMAGDLSSEDVKEPVTKMFEFIRDFEGVVPATEPIACGNCLDHNLPMARYEAKRYLDRCLYHLDEKHMVYQS